MKKTFSLFMILLAICLQLPAQSWETITVGSGIRKTYTYIPLNVEKSPALVISLHGMNQDPEYQQKQTQWNAMADKEGFIVTYPLGNNKMWDTNGTSDVKFVETVIKEMINQHHVDKNRIYLSGFSMGSWLGYHCLETIGDQIAAFGPVSGVDIGKQPKANRKVPIMHIHGTGDDVFKYTGDPSHMAGGYPSIEEYVKKWAAYEGCDANNPQVVRPYPSSRKTANATRTIYNNVNNDVEVNLISIDGKGHWHSNDPNGVNSTQELWNFFKRHRLNQHSTPDPNFQIYLCFGQSNMEGNAAIEAQDKTGVNPRFMAMYTLDNANAGWTKGKWHTATPPQARPYTRLSVVDYFGRKMVDNLSDEVKVGTITVAVGGASIDLFDKDKYQSYLNDVNTADWLRNYAKEYGGNPYGRLIELAKIAQKSGVIKGILLHQGETNNCDQTWPSKVKKIYEDMLADLGLDAKNVPLLVGELGQKDQNAACWGHNAIIDNITATIPTAHVVSSKDCPLQSDRLHFTAEGYRMFGKRYADVMLDILGVTPAEKRNYFIRYESTAGENLWDRQAIYTLPQALEKGARYSLTMKVRTSADCAELGFWPIWNASDNKNQWGGSDDVQYLAAYPIEAGGWKTLTWNFTANFPLDTFQFVFGKYGGTLDIDDLVLVKEGTSENLIANADFSAKHIQGWNTNWQGPSYYLANDAYQSTGITQPSVVAQPSQQDDAYYTLQGVRVSHPTSGIFIHKGRKIVMK
ncbi:sialate O-acetylesterase [Segatella copri]|nr:sialate O-acetylesterase [Segatella copri]